MGNMIKVKAWHKVKKETIYVLYMQPTNTGTDIWHNGVIWGTIEEDVEIEDQSWYWTERWQNGERLADINYEKKNIETFKNMDEFIDTL